ncbi:hypothetical protein BCY91_12715 [Pelobium manganitolerans]|uniref:Uncharacterized protein n=1 Tax=Pelobium manganitolerans TaxID=1842495 RepID=A0A419S202_9SPHI|nr:hypothetical protein [Pelobium manganitolerans]RKD12500.1 hypothetical protein BCY91_12715 [Pelobium manganitolerans]
MKQINKKLGIVGRLKSPTPKFFKTIRNIGLALGAVGATLLTAPVALPTGLLTVAGYLATAGLVASAISQSVQEQE